MPAKRKPRRVSPPRDTRRAKEATLIQAGLSQLGKEELAKIVFEQAKSNDDLWQELLERLKIEPTADSVTELIAWARRAIDEATSSRDWYGGDYEKVKELLNQLVDQGQADAVLELGRELNRRGERQVEMSDEGLMSDDIGECLVIVFDALAKSSLSPVEQMTWAWEVGGDDGYCICTEPNKKFWKRKFRPQDWSDFADVLLKRLTPPAPQAPKRRRRHSYVPPLRHDFARERHVNKAIEALTNAGRADEIATLREQEAAFQARRLLA